MSSNDFRLIAELPYALPAPTTFEEWRAFVDRPNPSRPAVPSTEQFKNMSDEEKRASKRERMIYHASFGPLEVDMLKNIHSAFLLLAKNNLRASPGARPGGIIDGLATLGKTTILMQLGRKYELALRKQYGIEQMPNGQMFIPVAYVSLPAETTIKSFNGVLADFYGIPLPRTASADFMTRQIKRHAASCGTSMILIDDIHYLKMRNRGAETVNNHLKNLANSISATFIYAGINCEGTGLLDEGNSHAQAIFAQTKKRFKKFDLQAYSQTTPEAKAQWLSLLATLDSHLCLVSHQPGTLQDKFSDYIFDRTSGFMGPVCALIREAANLAIINGDEKITRKLLDQVRLDHDSEEQYRRLSKARRQVQTTYAEVANP